MWGIYCQRRLTIFHTLDFPAEGPLLGRGSRLKRARSAKSKITEPSSPPSDVRLLIQEDSSSTHSDDPGLTNQSFMNGLSTNSNIKLPYKSPKTPWKKRVKSAKPEPRAIRQRPRPKTSQNRYYLLNFLPYTLNLHLNKVCFIVAFRVAPVEAQVPRRGQSATIPSQHIAEAPPSPPDPLDPWSTKDITNMNALLAWDNEDSM